MPLVLIVTALCILLGPYFWRQAIAGNLRTHGVRFYYIEVFPNSPSHFLRRVRKLPGMEDYGKRRQFAEMGIRKGLKTEHLPQIMKDLSALDVGLAIVNLTGSVNLTRDVELSQSKIVCRLIIEHSEISAAAVRLMQGMPSLGVLNLSGSQLNHLAFQELGALTGLRELVLDQASVTDVDLQTLTKLSNLKHLSLSNTEVSDTAKAELQQALPDLQITDD
ncbi:MAG: hypothetical protein V4719_27770 [Planctomycetota bacterium]